MLQTPKTDLPTYSPEAICSACGFDKISTQWIPNPEHACQRVYAPEEVVGNQRVCWYWKGEHMHRFCQRCGFKWAEAVVNPTGAVR
jgi:ribosomal protein L37E